MFVDLITLLPSIYKYGYRSALEARLYRIDKNGFKFPSTLHALNLRHKKVGVD